MNLYNYFLDVLYTTGDAVLDGNTFFISNKVHKQRRLSQWADGPSGYGSYEDLILHRNTGTERQYHEGQLWHLEQSPDHKGFYYIHNVKFQDYRLGNVVHQQNTSVDSVTGPYDTDQLWRFQYEGEGYYRIFNYRYPDVRLCMLRYDSYFHFNANSFWLRDGLPQAAQEELEQNPFQLGLCKDFRNEIGEEQLWKLEPRFHALFERVVAFHADNRNGLVDLPPQTVRVTRGISTTISTEKSQTTSFKLAVSTALEWGPVSAEVSAEYSSEISSSLSKSVEETMSKTTEKSYVAPAGYEYRVSYLKVKLAGNSPGDNLEFWAPEQSLCVEQSHEKLPATVPLNCPE